MALTSAQRRELLDKLLPHSLYRLDYHIEDIDDRREFLWAVAEHGEAYSYELLDPMAWHLPKQPDVALAFRYLNDLQFALREDRPPRHRHIVGWHHGAEVLMSNLADRRPDEFAQHWRTLELPLRELAEIVAMNHDLIAPADLSDEARALFMRSRVATSWDDSFFAHERDLFDHASFHSRAICSVAASGEAASVAWDVVREHIHAATASEAVAILAQVWMPNKRLVAREVMKAYPAEAAIEAIEQWMPTAQLAQKPPLMLALMRAYARAERPFPAANHDLVGEAASLDLEDLDVTREAYATLPVDVLQDVVLRAAERAGYAGRVAQLASLGGLGELSPLLEWVNGEMAVSMSGDTAVEHIGSSIARFGTTSVPLVVEALGAASATLAQQSLLHALASIGDASGIEACIEQLGASTKGTRVAAATAVESFGAAARPALESALDARKKAIREAAQRLLDAIGDGSSTPLEELESRYESADTAALDDLVKSMRTSNSYGSRDYKKFEPHIESLGNAALIPVRDWYLTDLQSWQSRTTYISALTEYGKGREAAWLAVEAIALADGQSTYELADTERQIRRFGELLVEPLQHFLRGAPPANRDMLLRLLIDMGAGDDPSVFVVAMGDSAKGIRELGVEGAVALGEAAVPGALELLTARKKAKRLGAAQFFEARPAPAQLEALRRAHAGEKTTDVAAVLERAIAQAGGSAHDLPADSSGADLDDFLAELAAGNRPSFLGDLPALVTVDGHTLREEAVTSYIVRLGNEGPDELDPLVRDIRARLDDTSADEFAVAIYDAWLDAGSPANQKWAVYQLAVNAAAHQVDTWAPTLDDLASSGNHHLASWYVDVLARHPDRHATSWLGHWARASQKSSVADPARAAIDSLAHEAGLDRESYLNSLDVYVADDVADRNTPTHGFETPIEVAYEGGRSFTILLDPNANVVVRDEETGKTRKSMPSARKAEDATDAKARFSALKKAVKRTVKDVVARLERAMVSGRTWRAREFEAIWTTHPVLSRIAGRIVFRGGARLFHVSEGALLDTDYDEVAPGEDDIVTIVHRLQLSTQEAAAWGRHFADSDLLQPFEQIGRPTFERDPAFDNGDDIGDVPRARLAGRLRSYGWTHGYAEDGGVVYTARRIFPGHGVVAHIEHGGFYIADPSWEGGDPVAVSPPRFTDLRGRAIALDDVPDIAYSEVRYDLARLLS